MILILLIIPYIILLVLGAKATWKLTLNVFPTSLDGGILIAILLFVVMFLVIGPVMGIVTLVKLIVIKVNMTQPKRPADCIRPVSSSENLADDNKTYIKENIQ
jgi:hypothetical protein